VERVEHDGNGPQITDHSYAAKALHCRARLTASAS
jgi:hypothetical protein